MDNQEALAGQNVVERLGMSAEEALAIACHLANVDDRVVVIIDPSGAWRPEWGILY